MATTAESSVLSNAATRTWSAAVAGGLAAGVIMGLLMQFVMGSMAMVGALYGQPTVAAGWTAHLIHSVIFALVFTAIVTRPSVRDYADSTTRLAGLGLAYGFAIWVVAASFVMPFWLTTIGAASPAIPTFDLMSLVGHLIYGLVLGSGYAIATRRLPARSADTASA